MILFIPVTIGNFIYQLITTIEAKIYGLEATTVNIDEMQISTLQNNNPNCPTILMLHGFSSDKVIWIRFAKYFKDDFNLVIPDLAGHGATGVNKDWDYSIPVQAERMLKLLDKLHIEKAHLIGNSMGGAIAAHFAKNYPQRTLSLAMIDPAGVIAPELGDMDKKLQQGKNPFLISNQQDFKTFYAMTMAKPPWAPSFVLKAFADKYIKRQPELMQIWSDFHKKDLLDDKLDQIKVKTLLIWGQKDRLIDVSSVKIWQQGIKHIEVKIYPEIGHMAMLETPKRSAELYFGFLRK